MYKRTLKTLGHFCGPIMDSSMAHTPQILSQYNVSEVVNSAGGRVPFILSCVDLFNSSWKETLKLNIPHACSRQYNKLVQYLAKYFIWRHLERKAIFVTLYWKFIHSTAAYVAALGKFLSFVHIMVRLVFGTVLQKKRQHKRNFMHKPSTL